MPRPRSKTTYTLEDHQHYSVRFDHFLHCATQEMLATTRRYSRLFARMASAAAAAQPKPSTAPTLPLSTNPMKATAPLQNPAMSSHQMPLTTACPHQNAASAAVDAICHHYPPAPRIATVSAPVDRMITVTWADGVAGQFPLVWLRDHSPDPSTYIFSPALTARSTLFTEFNVRQEASKIELTDDGSELLITWDSGLESRYNTTWLRARNPSDQEARNRRRDIYLDTTRTWDKKEIEQRLKKFDYFDVLNNPKDLHDMLEAVCLDGIAFIHGAPAARKGVVEPLIDKIGYIERTNLGTIYEVYTKPEASSLACISTATLPMHTDLPAMQRYPQVQLMYMLQQGAEGGSSLFVDGFRIAEDLRRDHPEAFDVLTKYELEYGEDGYDFHSVRDGQIDKFTFDLVGRHKVIDTDSRGRPTKITFSNGTRSWFYDCDPKNIQKIYDAMKLFADYCNKEEYTYRYRMEDGCMVLFANSRLLHSRDQFANPPGKSRTIVGCYMSWDMIKTRVRVLQKLCGIPRYQPSTP